MKNTKTKKLVTCAIMIALATVLSLIKLIDLPYGGSVTVASMLPIVIISYWYGIGYGLVSGAVYSVTQLLLGLDNLQYVTTWQSILAVILLDFIFAFIVTGLGGIFKKCVKNQAIAITLGAVFVCILRYAFHVISGATVWAGLSIPTEAALIYSFAYNATYMIPETIVLAASAYYFGSALDFSGDQPVRIKRSSKNKVPVFSIVAGLVLAAALVFDVASVFSKLQNADTGTWNINGLSMVNWVAVIIVSAVSIIVSLVLYLVGKKKSMSKEIK